MVTYLKFHTSQGRWRWVGRVGNSDLGQLPNQVLADQLTLYLAKGSDCTPRPNTLLYNLPTQLSVASYVPGREGESGLSAIHLGMINLAGQGR